MNGMRKSGGYLPNKLELSPQGGLFGERTIALELRGGLTVLVGPNAAGKTTTLRGLRDALDQDSDSLNGRKVVYLSAGRSSALEHFRSATTAPSQHFDRKTPAAIGHRQWTGSWSSYEGVAGMYMRLKARPDLLLKVEARLQGLHQRRLRLDWSQHGLEISFAPTTGENPYFANVEASGLLQLVPLLAAIYDDEIFALLIDEPEVSLHPQLQSFILQELLEAAGDPITDNTKKLIVIATHSSSMLPLRRIADIRNFVFFTDKDTDPVQVPIDAEEAKGRKLASLVARLSENHKLAMFARNILLVEGPSDEIVLAGLSRVLAHPILSANTQVVPVTGKGQFPETIKLFRLMQKKTFVLGDLDLLADDSQIIGSFQERAQPFVLDLGAADLSKIDREIRQTFNLLIDKSWAAIQSTASKHRYWISREQGEGAELKAKRRAGLAALLSLDIADLAKLPGGTDWLNIRRRYDALLDVLDKVGCIILRKGTIEDYYSTIQSAVSGKPESAAIEVEHLETLQEPEARIRYSDIVKALEVSAPIKRVNENDLLREQLGSLLGAAFQIVTPAISDVEFNSRTKANYGSDKPVFGVANRTKPDGKGGYARLIEVSITSPLFVRDGFPFVVGDKENLTDVIESKLP
jgi:hypothetical protein